MATRSSITPFCSGQGKEGRAPFAIPPVRYALVEGIALGGDSLVRLRYVGPAAARTASAFDLEVSASARCATLAEPRHFVPIANCPLSGDPGCGGDRPQI